MNLNEAYKPTIMNLTIVIHNYYQPKLRRF